MGKQRGTAKMRKRITIECARCGAEKSMRKDHASRSENNYCSRTCGIAHARAIRVSGANPSRRIVAYTKIGTTYRRTHVVIAENILGRRLTIKEVVHHIDENPLNNAHSNLVIMNRDDHTTLHWRMNSRRSSMRLSARRSANSVRLNASCRKQSSGQ